ncbi:MAG: hypothetical protein KC609_05570, partial [Myxococcales bacterium]|nr:hypothetical protein [Myxococcales bacterium]
MVGLVLICAICLSAGGCIPPRLYETVDEGQRCSNSGDKLVVCKQPFVCYAEMCVRMENLPSTAECNIQGF